MKRRFLAWVTAAAMLITSVPGNAITAFAEEVPEEVAAEAVSVEDPVEPEVPAEESADLLEAEPELEEDSAAEEILTEDISADAADPADEDLVEDFTIEEDDPEENMLQDGILFAEDEDSPAEEDALSEEEILTAESDSEITGIELSCKDPSGLLDPDSETYMNKLRDLLEAAVTYADGEQETLTDWDWEYCQIDETSYAVLANYSAGVGILAKDSAGAVLPSFAQGAYSLPVGCEVWLQPFILDSGDYNQFEDSQICVSFPAISDVMPLTEGEAAAVGSEGWFSFAQDGVGPYAVTVSADSEADVEWKIFRYYELDSYGFLDHWSGGGLGSGYTSTAFVNGDTSSEYYVYVKNPSPESSVTVEVQEASAVSAIELEDATVSRFELSQKSFENCFHATTICADQSEYPVSFNQIAQNGDTITHIYGYNTRGEYIEIRAVDENGNSSDFGSADEGQEGLIPAGEYRIQAVYASVTGEIRSEIRTLTVTEGMPESTTLAEGQTADYSVSSGDAVYFRPVAEEDDEYRFALTGTSDGNSQVDITIYETSDDSIEQVYNTTLYLSGEEQTFDVTLSGGTEYLLQLSKPSWDMGSTNGTISFYSISKQEQREYERILAAAVPIQPGQTKDAVWKANEDTRNYFLFEPEESGTYLFYSDGTIDTRVTLYEVTETHLENIDDNDDGRNDDYCNFLLRSELTAGKSYIYETYLWGSTSTEESSTVTLETVPTLESVVLNYSGSTPTFIEGLSSGWNAYPFSLFGDHLNASVKYENQDPEVFEDVNEESVITKYGDYYRFAAIQGFDTDGTPVNATTKPGAGEWYAALAEVGYGEDEEEICTFLPKTKQEAEWTASLDTVSTVPFTVITKAEAASANAFDGNSVTIDPENTYYAGAALTAGQDGMVEFASDLAMDTVCLYKAGTADAEDESVLVSKTDNFTWKAELEAGQTYYLFVRPSQVKPFTITAGKPVTIVRAEITSRLASTIRPLEEVTVNDFSVDLTYDDGSVAHLTGGEQDAYGNSFRYEAESDDDYYYVSNQNYSETLRQGSYQVRAVLNASGSYIYSDSTFPLTVSDPGEAETVETAAVQTVAAGSKPLYRFVPEETGFYTILLNGAPYYGGGDGWYRENWRETLEEDSDHMLDASTAMLQEGTVYYIPIGEDAVDQYIAVTRRYPVEIGESGSNYELNAKADANSQFLFTVPENGTFRIAMDAGTISSGFHWELKEYISDDEWCRGLGDGYSNGSSAEIYYGLREGNTYLLSFWAVDQMDDFSMTFSVETAEAEATVDVAIDTEYPAAFAGDFPQEVIQITETIGDRTQNLTVYENSSWSGANYWLEGNYGVGHSKTFYISGGFLGDVSKSVQAAFNEHAIDDAPFLSAGTACTDGYRIKNTWFYFFIPEETGLYHIEYQGSDQSNWVVRTYDNRYWTRQDSMQLQAGVKCAIACHDPEAAGSPALTISKVRDVERVEITRAPAGILRQNLNGGSDCEVTVTYSDGTSQTYQLPGRYEDDYGNRFNTSGAILPLAEGSDPANQKVRFKVEIGGRRASCDVPLLAAATLPTFADSEGSAVETAYSAGMTWYKYSPEEDGYYGFCSTFTQRMNYGWSVYEEGSPSSLRYPIYLRHGQVYVVGVYTMRETSGKTWAEKIENSTVSDMKTLTYEFVPEDASATLPQAVRNVLPEGGNYLRDTELAVAQPGTTEVSLAAGTWTFLGYDSAETVRLDTDRTITGTWSFEAAGTQPCEHTQLRLVEAKAATCTEDGYEAYYECEECGRLFSDAAGTEEILSPAVIPGGHILAFHAKAEADCEHDGYEAYYECSRCGKQFSDAAGTKEIDAPVVIPGGHNLVFHEKAEPTCDAYGCEAYYECSRCNKLFSDAAGENQIEKTIPIPPSHELTFMEAVEPTCTEAGTAAHYVCDNCGRLFSDAAGTEEITADSVVIPAAGHTYNLVEANAPTADEPGNIEHYHCPKCGKNFSDTTGAVELTDDQIVIPKLGSYNVTFHGNGGYSVNDETQDVEVVVTTAGECVESIPQFVHPEGLELLGWAAASDSTQTVDLENYPIRQAEDFYAVWKAKELQTFTITYEFRSESDRALPQEILNIQNSMQGGTVLEGESAEAQRPVPDRIETDDGYKWYFDYYVNDSVEEAYENITFVGWWDCEAPEGDCKITWHKNYNGSTETETEWVNSEAWLWDGPSYWNKDEDILAADLISGGFYVGSPEGELIDATADRGDHYEVTGNVDLYVYWVDAVTVTWDPMGGTWEYYDHETPSTATAPKTVRYYLGQYLSSNEEGDLTAPDDNLVFAGWSREPDGEIFIPDNSSQRAAEDLDGKTLYAVYTEPITITLELGEGCQILSGYDDDGKPEYEDFPYTTWPVEIPRGGYYGVSEILFAKEGFIITKWVAADNPDQIYEPERNYTFDRDITLIAVWAEKASITWDPNGGRWEYGENRLAPRTEYYGLGESIWSENLELRPGYVLLGWSDQPSGGEIVAEPGRRYTVSQKTITLYAQWTEGYKVTLIGNGGHTNSTYPMTEDVTMIPAGETISSLTTFVREGMALVGWALDPEGNHPVENIWTYVINEDTTFYAQWEPGYTVTFELGEGSLTYGGGANTFTEVFTEDSTLSPLYWMYNITPPAGKVFVGWSVRQNDPTGVISPNDPLKITQDTTVYAIYEEAFEVTFDGNGGFFEEDGEKKAVIRQNQQKGKPLSGLYLPEHPDDTMILLGFSTTKDRKDLVYNVYQDYQWNQNYLVTEDVTLYAIWVPYHKVIFDGNGKEINQWNHSDRYEQNWPDGEGYYGWLLNVIPQNLADEFKGWSTSPSGYPLFDFEGKTVTSDMTFYAVWGEVQVPKYQVSYEFVSSSDKELPREVLALKPVAAEYEDGSTVTAAQMPERVDTEDGHWVFDGYDKDSITINGEGGVFTGTWTFVEERATVVYTFVSADGSDLPAEVTALMPDYETTVVKGTEMIPVSPKADSVEVGDCNWIFNGYDPASAKAGGEGTTVTFTGTWRAVAKETTIYYITYQFTPATLPAEVMELLPARTPVEKGAAPVCASLTKTSVATEDGNWIFEGFDTSALPSEMTGDVTVTGNWRFESKEEAADVAAGMITDITGDTDSNELIDALEKSDSADILDQLTENLKTEAGDDEDALNELLAGATNKVDDLLAEGDKITVNTGSQTVGAYVGKTEAGEDDETGVKVEVSGATATVASVIRNLDMATLLANDSKNYHYVAAVDVEKKAETGNSLTLDISLNVVIQETGAVVKENVEPTSPVTITLTLPEDYVGYDLTVIHTKADGSTETVKVSYINAETQIRFTVSSLSPFKLQKGEDRHPAEYVAEQKATCAKAGHTEYWTRMGRKYKDEACTIELADADIQIPKTSVHTWNAGIVTKKATEDVTGIRTYTCKVCGHKKTAVIPKVKVKITITKKPAKFKAKAAKKGKVNLTWTKLAKKGKTKALFAQVKNYEIQYSTDRTFATGVVKLTPSKKKAKLTLKLKPKMTYYVRIRYADGKGGYSPWVRKTVKTKK